MANVAEYYENYWSGSGFCPKGRISDWQRELFEAHLRRGSRCLDLGCGDGGTSGVFLRKEGFEYQGVDVSRAAIEQARLNGLNVTLIDDASSLPFDDRDFDAVICFEVVEHLFDVNGTMAEILRILRPGGCLLLTTPNICYWRRRLDALCGRWNPLGDGKSVSEPWRDPHIRFFTRRSLVNCLRCAGFNPVTVNATGGAFLKDLPIIGKWFPQRGGTAYRGIEKALPAVFGYRLVAVAQKLNVD